MALSKYRVDGSEPLRLANMSTDGAEDNVVKEEIRTETAALSKEMGRLQERLYADGREGLIIVLQALDAAGKDSTVKHVMSGINPQGVTVHSFKQPSSEELAHDYLWRVNASLPRRGMIALFNRSYYEDVLVARVDHLNRVYHMPDRIIGEDEEKFFDRRYRQIRSYERYLYENGYRIVKLFLNVSCEEQKKRFLERIDKPEKNWKFSSSDLKVRGQWDAYQEAYELAINGTATKECPWYVLPADRKWYTRYLVSKAIVRALKEMNPQFPVLPEDEQARLGSCREILEAEK